MNTRDKQEFLKKQFLQCVKIKNPQRGYLSVKEFNLAIDPDILQIASRCWAEQYRHDTHIDAIVGLPDAGSRLVSVLAEMLRPKYILPSKKTKIIPESWEDVVSYSNDSFTTNQKNIHSHIGFACKGQRILIVDDVVAHGTTAITAIKALQKAGIEVVGLAVLFDKEWQGGVKKIKKETGIDTFSLINIKKITKDGEVVI